jgi:hypothetical protein
MRLFVPSPNFIFQKAHWFTDAKRIKNLGLVKPFRLLKKN